MKKTSKNSIKNKIWYGFFLFSIWLITTVSVSSIAMKHSEEFEWIRLLNIVVTIFGVIPFGYFVIILQSITDKLPPD